MQGFLLRRSAIQSVQRSLVLSTALPASRFSTSHYRFSITGKVQEAAETLNKKAGQAASKGIEGLETATEKVKSATGTASSQAQNISQDAVNEAKSAKESAKGLAKDAQKKASS